MLGHEPRTPSRAYLRAQMLSRGRGIDAAKLARVGAAIERGTGCAQLIDDPLMPRDRFRKLEMGLKAVDPLCGRQGGARRGCLAARRKTIRLDVTR
jgi:hypothetical protein